MADAVRDNTGTAALGLGVGWRSALALMIERREGLGFVEITHEDFPLELPLPEPVESLRRRGVKVVPHGLGLSLGGAERPDKARLRTLAAQAARVGAPLVSEHIAFVRAEGREVGHLMPVPRTRAMLEILVQNVREAMEALSVPLALENIATLFEWPGAEMSEADFLTEVLERTGALLLLDVENLYANAKNHGFDASAFLDRAPLDRIAYMHVAGGVERDGVYHDTHFHPIPAGVLELVSQVAARVRVPGVMLERDDAFTPTAPVDSELDAIAAAWRAGGEKREALRV